VCALDVGNYEEGFSKTSEVTSKLNDFCDIYNLLIDN